MPLHLLEIINGTPAEKIVIAHRMLGREVHLLEVEPLGFQDPGGGRRQGIQSRALIGGHPLDQAVVGGAPHRDLAITERLFADPGHHVKTIRPLVPEFDDFTFGLEQAADILDDAHVSARGEQPSLDLECTLAIHAPEQEHGQGFCVSRMKISMGAEADAIAHGDHEGLSLEVCGLECRDRPAKAWDQKDQDPCQ